MVRQPKTAVFFAKIAKTPRRQRVKDFMQDGKHNTPLVFEKHTEQILYHKPKLLCFSNLIDETISYVLLQ